MFNYRNQGKMSFGFNSVSDFTNVAGGTIQITTDWTDYEGEEMKPSCFKCGLQKPVSDVGVPRKWWLKSLIYLFFCHHSSLIQIQFPRRKKKNKIKAHYVQICFCRSNCVLYNVLRVA